LGFFLEKSGLIINTSKIEVEMHQRINKKLENVKATSKKTAVTPKEPNLELQEKFWVPYFLGNIRGRIFMKKNKDNRINNFFELTRINL
jgi:hypothetical protein